MSNRHKAFSVRCQAETGEAEITIYDVIDPWFGISARQIRDTLKDLGNVSRITLRINSPGGSVFDGIAIYNLLKQHPAQVVAKIDGLAASMASIIAMAADRIEMGAGAFIMIHNPWDLAMGTADDLRGVADLLDKMTAQFVGIYADRTKCDPDKITEMMDAETWLTADEALSMGFADGVVDQPALAAAFDLSVFGRVPKSLLPKGNATMPKKSKAAAEAIEPADGTFETNAGADNAAGEAVNTDGQVVEVVIDQAAEVAETPEETPAVTAEEAAPVPDEATAQAAAVPVGQAEAAPVNQGQRFLDAFGDRGGVYFAKGMTFEAAMSAEYQALKAENADLRKRLAAVNWGQAKAVSSEPEPAPVAGAGDGVVMPTEGDNVAKIAAGLKLQQ